MVNSRGGTYTPSQTIVTGISHSPHGSHHSTFSAIASPSTNSPTGSSSLTKIVVAQVFLLLSTIKEDKDRTKWEQQVEQLRKLIDEHGMEVFQKYFSRLVVGNAPQIFPGVNRSVANPGNYQILVNEVRKISRDVEQAGKIAESIETANEDIFRDFDLSTFMEHFKLDALEKTILALAFKNGTKSDLKAKADALISNNYPQFLQILVRTKNEDLGPEFVATIIDRLIQAESPSFDQKAQRELALAIQYRYEHSEQDPAPPTTVLAALYLLNILSDRNSLSQYMHRIGAAFTADEDTCTEYLRNASSLSLTEEQVSMALVYSAISKTPQFSPELLVKGLRRELGSQFNWPEVVAHFDQQELRISQQQFLLLYKALRPLAIDDVIDIQRLWGGKWQHTETQLSFIGAFASLDPSELDVTTIPKLQASFSLDDYARSSPQIQERAAYAVTHPLISVAALEAIFNVALHDAPASETPEAKRLFQQVVLPKLDIFMVSAFGVTKPWPELASDTLHTLFERFLMKYDPNYDFVLESIWRKDRGWVAQRLVEAHAKSPLDLPSILDHAVRHQWLDDLTTIHNGFGLDLAAIAHARGLLDIEAWSKKATGARATEFAQSLLTFLSIKATHELGFQRNEELSSVMLPVKTVAAFLRVLEDILPKSPTQELIVVQRTCITAYPRLINYNEGFNDIIDANGAEKNSLPREANDKMEEHYKRMYCDDLQVRNVVDALEGYKRSRDPADQDVFACMIHGLFDEYVLYGTYPLEALATTAVLFGGIISRKLIDNLPLEIGLGMILEAVRDHSPELSMYKFGLQALMQLFSRLREWPGFCRRLLQVPGLRGTEAWNTAEEVIRSQQEDETLNFHINGGAATNGNVDEILATEPSALPFSSLYVDPPQHIYDDPDDATQDKIQFVLNNITAENLESKFNELRGVIDDENQQWFAGHLVSQRAKTQPNYHRLYLNLVKLFEKKSLWAEILRETYVCTFRSLNSEAILAQSNSVERQYLKNLAAWLGSLTLARDKPIKHSNIAFKHLLTEGYQSNRLLIVIPFVCKVLAQGKDSTVFKPPNPWVMDVVRALRELYLGADLKLNLKFEIEVLLGELNIEPKTIEPSDEIMSRLPYVEDTTDSVLGPELVDRLENLSLNEMGGAVNGGRFSPPDITSSIPDLGPLLVYPPANEIVNQSQLQEIVRSAITRAVYEIIHPVVERSVTIAAISTAQMIKKDFATEPNEAKVRAAAILMVKKTAGSLALVTSKEPLRASMTNYIRGLSSELPQGLPEGTIIMCVNSNLELACSQVEKKAEERAIPEIEEMIEPELEARRVHRMTRPDEPYMDPGLTRWSLTIPNPFRLQPNMNGLNHEQMAIYDDFGRPRIPSSLSGTTHAASSSDATRSMANEVLQDQYSSMPTLPAPAEPPPISHLNTQQQVYAQPNASIVNGRLPSAAMDPRTLAERVQKALIELERVVSETSEEHYADLPRPHAVVDVLDALISLIIRTSQSPEALDIFIVDQICNLLFGSAEQGLMIESLVHVLENIRKIGGRTASRVALVIAHQPGESLLRVPLALSLVKAEMVEWHRIDSETSKALIQRTEGSLQFFSSLIEVALLNERPMALFSDFARSLEVAWQWIEEDPSLEEGQQLKQKLRACGVTLDLSRDSDDRLTALRDQMEYVFDEWVHLRSNSNASERAAHHFISQMYKKQVINSLDDFCVFLRLSIDCSVDRFEQHMQNNSNLSDAYMPIDSLANLIAMIVRRRDQEGEVKVDKAAHLKSILSLVLLVLNHHHVMRGEHFNQKVFFRLFTSLLGDLHSHGEDFSESERQEIILTFADILLDIRPSYFPGFIFGYLGLVSHRSFLPVIMGLPNQLGWTAMADIMEGIMFYLGELLKPLRISLVSKDLYRGVLKAIVIFHHDFPEFLAANHTKLCANIPSHCIQLHNLILNATPASKLPDPLQPGLKVDRVDEMRESPDIMNDVEAPLRRIGLLDVVNQALQNGPSEDAVAHISHEIQGKKTRHSSVGYVPINVDLKLIDSLVVHIGMQSVAKESQKGGSVFVATSPDVTLLSMLVHELRPEARYFFLSSIISQLRFPNSHTNYFTQALLELFGNDLNDQEESDIRQQVTRILLERLIGQWPQPWGLIVTIHELIKNDKYMFFELPFIKSAPEVGERFAALASRHI